MKKIIVVYLLCITQYLVCPSIRRNDSSQILTDQINAVDNAYSTFLEQLYKILNQNNLIPGDVKALTAAINDFKTNALSQDFDKFINAYKSSLSGDAFSLLSIVREQAPLIETSGFARTRGTWKPDTVNFFEGVKALLTVYTQ